MSSNDPKQDVEEGVPPTMEDVDTKSDAGSATTAPSVESGDADSSTKEAAAVAPKSRRWMLLGGAAAVLVVAGVVIGAVVGTCDKNKTTTASASSKATTIDIGPEDEAKPPMYPHSDGVVPDFDPPFGDIDLPLFEADVLESYTSVEDLQVDLTKATKEMINKIILQNIEYRSHEYYGYHDEMMEDIAMEAGVGMASASAKQASQKKVLNSMTNNQEKDVDESDVLKTDGSYVYAAYGDYLVVWDLEGNMVTQEKMPVPETPTKEETQESMSMNTDDWMMDDMMWDMISAYAYIDSIQITEKHIILAVGGMGQYSDTSISGGEGGTHVRVYNKPTAVNPTLQLVATRELNGYFFDSRYLEASNSVHIVTGGDISTYSDIVEPLDVYHFAGLNHTEYYYAAKLLAETELIPRFVKRLTEFLMVDGQMPTMMKVNNWLTAAQADAKKDNHKMYPEEHFYGSYDESMRAYMMVTSIQADAIPTTPGDENTLLQVSTTGMVGPTSWGFMYAAEDNIIVHMQKFDFDPETTMSDETLFLIHLKVAADSSETSFYSVASMNGSLPTMRSMDILGDDLRIATTHQKWMPLENVWPVCGDSWYFEDTCMNEENWNDCFEVALGCREVVKTGCPYTFECVDEEGSEESSTDNFVSVFDISQPGQMQERGSVRIGEPHERIMGVHFGETFSYANTFDQRDPFYVLNLPAGQAPTIAGELKLEGFSSVLQPLNEDASLVVGIGQNVTGQGMEQAPNGLLVTVFDVSDPANPKALASDMLVDPNEKDSYSDAEWDPKAVQINDGILVMPITLYHKYGGGNDDMWSRGEDTVPPGEMENIDQVLAAEEQWAAMSAEQESKNFEGFIVLDLTDVANQGIKEVTRISHKKHQSYGHNSENCHYCSHGMSYRRSFLFDDKSLMTVHDNAVISTDLASGNTLWSFNITMEGEEMNCCY